MIEITDYAYKILLNTLSDNLHKSSEYGSPPIFYWYRNMIEETRKIESCRYLRRGEFQYRLGYNLGIAYITCQYIGRKRFLIVTNYDINTKVLFSWKGQPNRNGVIPKVKPTKPRKAFRRLTTKPLFGYSFVMNEKKEYNLLDSNGKLLTQWFRAIRPINQSQPYGKYRIIAYINVGGFFCALGYDGQVYNLNKTWREMCSENRIFLNTELFMNIITENIDNTMRNKKVIRLTESDLHNIIQESVITLLNEMDWTDYFKARKKHPNLMKQVDARTFANRAKGINAQGKDRNDDQQAMRHAARHAWNDAFGYENHVKYGNGDVDADSLGMWGSMEAPCDYGIERNLSKYRNHSCVSRGDSGIYNPKVDKTYKPSNGISKGVGIDGIPQKGLDVAKQMAQGNGKYIPKKGWQ